MRLFHNDFLIGAATAAHQVEGNNKNSDSWALEHSPYGGFQEPSLDACNHYHRFEEDIRLMAKAGLNAYRFSIEWARIEPKEGVFDDKEVEHYRQVIDCCLRYGLEPIVTMHHFTSPLWLIQKGGWEAESTVSYFARYVRYTAERLGENLHYICTINEANMGIQIRSIAQEFLNQMVADGKIQMGISLESLMEGGKEKAEENRKIFGTSAPQVFQSPRTDKGDQIIMKAHQAAKEEIKKLFPDIKVGLTLSLHDIQAVSGGEKRAQEEWNKEFLHYLPYIQEDDFLGVQNYSRSRYGKDGSLPVPEGAEQTQMGYEYYPEGISHVLRRVSKDFKGELLVTENGIAVSDDKRRIAFIQKATEGIAECVKDRIPVKGYIYWSLLDNFEWQKGYGMTFGLVSVDRLHGQTRIPKESLYYLGTLCGRD